VCLLYLVSVRAYQCCFGQCPVSEVQFVVHSLSTFGCTSVFMLSMTHLLGHDFNFERNFWGRILLRKRKYVYLVEFAMQNIKLAFKQRDLLWLKNFYYISVWKQDTTVNLHELNEKPFLLSLVLSFWSSLPHRPAVIG
jgi:hypothetical protein